MPPYNTCMSFPPPPPHQNTDNLQNTTKIRSILQYCLLFKQHCNFRLAACCPRKPMPKASDFWLDRVHHDISAVYTLSFLKRGSYVKIEQVLCWWNCHVSLLLLPLSPEHHGPLPAMQLDMHSSHNWHEASCEQNAVCHHVSGMHMCGEQRGLDCAACLNHTMRTCPSSVIPSGIGQ